MVKKPTAGSVLTLVGFELGKWFLVELFQFWKTEVFRTVLAPVDGHRELCYKSILVTIFNAKLPAYDDLETPGSNHKNGQFVGLLVSHGLSTFTNRYLPHIPAFTNNN